MKIKNSFRAVQLLVGAAIAVFAISFVVPAFGQAQGNSTVLAVPGMASLGFEDPVLNTKAQPASGIPATQVGLPTSTAVGTVSLITNLTFRVVRNSDVTLTIFGRSQITNATASNAIAFIELSPDGRIWATNTPLTATWTPVQSNAFTRQFIYAATNFGQNAYGRVRYATNAGSTGNGSYFLSNVTVSTWSPLPNFSTR